MFRRLTAGIIIIILLALIASSPPALASSQPGQYSINVTNSSVSVSLKLSLFQNMTFFDRSFALPQLRVSAVGSNSTGLAGTIQRALQLKSPNVLVSNLQLQLASSPWSNVTQRQWLNESFSFDVGGAVSSAGSVAHIDLSWKSFVVPSSYSLGGVEVNQIGEAYFSSVAVYLASANVIGQFISTAYFVNGQELGPSQFASASGVGEISTLNFSSFSTPLSSWKESYTSLAGTGWTLNGRPGLGMEFVQQFSEPGSASRAIYGLFYDLNASVSSPRSARVEGDVLTIVINSFPETVMSLIIASIAVVGSVTYAWERRVLNSVVQKKPRR